MKRAKIMLSALAVLAVVGSALAFKANKAFTGDLRCTNLGTTTTICPNSTYAVTTDTMEGAIRACTGTNEPDGALCTTALVKLTP